MLYSICCYSVSGEFMTRIFRAPTFYIQGPGSLKLIGEKAATLGRSVLAICDALVLPQIEIELTESLNRQDISPIVVADQYARRCHCYTRSDPSRQLDCLWFRPVWQVGRQQPEKWHYERDYY